MEASGTYRLLGSSPLARGLLPARQASGAGARIIPARAGFTAGTPRSSPWSSDHPRSRGVYGGHLEWPREHRGSSPLARGLRSTPEQQGPRSRIIPARAGFTSPATTRGPIRSDHPRSRGVYDRRFCAASISAGSSPLARGLRPACRRRGRRQRIIPARAGFTLRHRPGGYEHWDHPRSRGVYPPGHAQAPPACGSSPLARGLPSPLVTEPTSKGIIPARAGFTPAFLPHANP